MDPLPAKLYDSGMEYDLIALCVKVAENFFKGFIPEPAWLITASGLNTRGPASFKYGCFDYFCFLRDSFLFVHS